MPDEQLNIDFGTDELNDPNYEANAGADDAASTQQTPDGAAQQGGDGAPAQGTDTAQQPSTTDGAGDGANQAGPAQQGQPQGAAPADQQQQQQVGKHKTDKDGNIVDAQGNIVARAGAERRTFERTQAQQSYIGRLENELAELKRTDNMARALNEVPSKLGLDMRETELGLQAIASFKKDPVATARWMLQETMRMGYNLQQIVGQDAQGQINGGSLDLQAVKGMINEALHPIVQDRNAQQQQNEADQSAQREYERFIAGHDHANVHEDVIARLMQGNRSLTPEVAYWQLREYAAKHQLDFTKPLSPQMQARQQGGNASQGNAAPQSQQQQPMPNGAAPVNDMQTQPAYADADDAWDNIVNTSLREAGMLQ